MLTSPRWTVLMITGDVQVCACAQFMLIHAYVHSPCWNMCMFAAHVQTCACSQYVPKHVYVYVVRWDMRMFTVHVEMCKCAKCFWSMWIFTVHVEACNSLTVHIVENLWTSCSQVFHRGAASDLSLPNLVEWLQKRKFSWERTAMLTWKPSGFEISMWRQILFEPFYRR